MVHRSARLPSVILCTLFAAVAPRAGAVETVSPGEVGGETGFAAACPTFHWTADSAAAGFELAVAEVVAEGGDGEPYRRLWSHDLPAGASGWTAAGERCLAAGRSYVWSIRQRLPDAEPGEGWDAPAWAAARRFEVPDAVSGADLAEALEIVRRYLGASGRGEVSPLRGAVPAQVLALPASRQLATGVPDAAPTGVAALSGTYPGATGETYGVYGRTDSLAGRGVVGYNSSTGGGTGTGVFGQAESDAGIGVWGVASWGPAPGYSTFGVYGQTYSHGGSGVLGRGESITGTSRGVTGSTAANQGIGVVGLATASSGTTFGTFGNAYSTSGTGASGLAGANTGTTFGVSGESESTTAARGVYGLASSTLGNAIGVLGATNGTSASAYGVYGIAPGGSAAYAGYFQGGVNVVGNLSKSSGSFQIDHPLDPENKYLFHSFVESPDMMNVYNGNLTLDENGEAWVELPAWFQALNRDFRYQLTPIGDWTACWIAREVEDNRFLVRGGPHGRISWQVTGIRQDPWAERHRIEVEVDKGPEERGRYLHAHEWGVLEELGLEWEMRQEILRERERPLRPGEAGDVP